MYPAFTKYPGGAVMVCEDVSEFDPMEAGRTDPEEEGTVAERKVSLAKSANPTLSSNPLATMISSLEPVWREVVEPMLRTDYHYESPEAGIETLNRVVTGLNRIVEAIRFAIIGTPLTLKVFGREYINEPFACKLGYFMKNAGTIRREGLESYDHSYRSLPVFEPWQTYKMIGAFLDTPAMDDIITGSEMGARLGSSHPLAIRFDGSIDFLRCVFENPERLARMETETQITVCLDDLLIAESPKWYKIHEMEDDDEAKFRCSFLRGMSKILKDISQRSYDMASDLLDGRLPPDAYALELRGFLNRCVNLFAFGCMLALSDAEQVQSVISRRRAVEAYVKRVSEVIP